MRAAACFAEMRAQGDALLAQGAPVAELDLSLRHAEAAFRLLLRLAEMGG